MIAPGTNRKPGRLPDMKAMMMIVELVLLFFNCEGSASATATIDHIYFNIISLPVKQVYTGFLSPYVRDVHYDFWQPPRFVPC